MNKTLKKRGTRKRIKNKTNKTRRRQGGTNKNYNCKQKCKKQFLNEMKQDKRYKAMEKISSFFNKNLNLKDSNKLSVEDELNKILDNKDIQSDEVFQDCVKECEIK
jgi:hypothetical protein